LGTVFSTILFSQLAQYRKCKVFSIDLNVKHFFESIQKTHFFDTLKNNVVFLEGSSISSKDFWSFYDNAPKQLIGNTTFNNVKDNIHKMVKTSFGIRKWNVLTKLFQVDTYDEIDVKKLFFSDNGLIFPKDIINIFSYEGDEFDFFKKSNEVGVLNNLLSKVDCFDLIFFDSGEFSSYIEWNLLNDRIRKGGIAVFHDIYFPKSFKNFLICSALFSDPHWKIIYQDLNTPQGLLIAQKIQ